ncbi:MAG: alpha/beta hydrolase [Alphaproteobacteria bacterium]
MKSSKPPVIMVHGAFCASWTFDMFRQPFEQAGHSVLCPDLRGHSEGTGRDAVVGVSMTDYARDIAELCRRSPEPPILVGHSMGGLVAQLVASRAKIHALVLLAPSPPWGVSGSSIEEASTAVGLHLLGPFWMQAVSPDRSLMRNYSLDRMPPAERDAILNKLRCESGRALWETLNWWLDPFMTTSLGIGPLKLPSLVMVGSRDVVHPPMTARMTAERIGAQYLEFPEMSHWLPGEKGWENVAAQAMDWLATTYAPA